MASRSGRDGAVYIALQTALEFDFSLETWTVSDPPGGEQDFAAADSFAISFWLFVDSTGDGNVFDKRSGTTGYRLQVLANVLVFSIGDGTVTTTITGSTSVNDNKWHHILCVRDVVADEIRLYLDGVQDTAAVTDGTTTTLENAASLIVGGVSNLRKYSQFRMFNVSFSDAEAALIAAGVYAPTSAIKAGIVAEYTAIEGDGSVLHDDSKFGNNAVISAGNLWVTTTFDTEMAEVPSGAIPGTVYTLANENVDNDPSTLTITVDGSPITPSQYKITTKGTITLDTATVATITVTYNHFPITIEAGAFKEWSLNLTHEAFDATNFNSNEAMEWVEGGIVGWNATLQRLWINSGLVYDIIRSRIIFRLYHDRVNDKYFHGWANISSVEPTVDVQALIEETVIIQGTDFISNQDS